MSEPLVSVLMCAFNGRGVIEQAVSDIQAQSYSTWELLIGDDGSTDGTREWLESLGDPRIRVMLHPQNLGYVGNKNALLREARGDLITQQDQDDRSRPDRLAVQVEALASARVDIVACGCRRLAMDGQVKDMMAPRESILLKEKGDAAYPFWFPPMLATRRVYDTVGEWNPYFAGAFGDDLYWTVRANERFPILVLRDVMYDYCDTPASITSLLDNPRKLIMLEILDHLLRQRRMTGTDDLDRGDLTALQALEKRLSTDRNLLAARYCTYAARSIEQRRMGEALHLLREAVRTAPLRVSNLRTLLYYWRSRRQQHSPKIVQGRS